MARSPPAATLDPASLAPLAQAAAPGAAAGGASPKAIAAAVAAALRTGAGLARGEQHQDVVDEVMGRIGMVVPSLAEWWWQEPAPILLRVSGGKRAFRNAGLHVDLGCGAENLPKPAREAKQRGRGGRRCPLAKQGVEERSLSSSESTGVAESCKTTDEAKEVGAAMCDGEVLVLESTRLELVTEEVGEEKDIDIEAEQIEVCDVKVRGHEEGLGGRDCDGHIIERKSVNPVGDEFEDKRKEVEGIAKPPTTYKSWNPVGDECEGNQKDDVGTVNPIAMKKNVEGIVNAAAVSALPGWDRADLSPRELVMEAAEAGCRKEVLGNFLRALLADEHG